MKMITMMIAIAMMSSMVAYGAMDENPYTQPDGTYISLSGIAVNAQPDGFTLDYGDGLVYVEMDDWDWYGDNIGVLEGDKVTVYGMVDDDAFETTSIEAGSVYVESMGTYFYANPADEESAVDYTWVYYTPMTAGYTTLRGTVTSKVGRTFTLSTGTQSITVDTATMPYNPLDDMGYQQIDAGDYVSVTGIIDYDFWDGLEFEADTVITLQQD